MVQSNLHSLLATPVVVPAVAVASLSTRLPGVHVAPEVDFILRHKVNMQSQCDCSVSLCATTPREHGFTEGYDLLAFYHAVKAAGLSELPAISGLALRRQYAGQPEGESVHIGMSPVPDVGGGQQVLSLEHHRHGRGLWLAVFRWHADIQSLVCADTVWLFAHKNRHGP